MSKKGLGRGIGSLIRDYTFDDVVQDTVTGESVLEIAVNSVDHNPNQPRQWFDQEALDELADSIKEQGVLQPILVEKQDDQRYIIIAGERRFRAARQAGLETIPAIVKTYSENRRLEIALIENLQRENLNPVEEAKAFRYLIDSAGISQEELSKRLGKKRSTIANSLRLLNLPEEMQEALKSHAISSGHARAVLSVVNPADQEFLFRQIIEEGLSVRETEKRAQKLNEGGRASHQKKKKSSKNRRPPEIERLEEQFLEALGTKVTIKGNLQRGKLEVSFFSEEDLQRLFDLIVSNTRSSEEL